MHFNWVPITGYEFKIIQYDKYTRKTYLKNQRAGYKNIIKKNQESI